MQDVNRGKFYNLTRIKIKKVREFLIVCTQSQRDNFIKSFLSGGYSPRMWIEDSVTIWNRYKDKIQIPKSIKDLEEMHDYITTEAVKLESKDFPLSFSEKVQQIDGVVLGDLRLEIPKSNYKLIEYGQKLHNCIGGYGRQLLETPTKNSMWVMAVYKNEVLMYNLQINRNKINQFYGKRNSLPDQKDQRIVVEYLKNEGLVGFEQLTPPLDDHLDAVRYAVANMADRLNHDMVVPGDENAG